MDFTVLLVCTANVCRSPAAAARLAELLRGVPGVHVTSAGAGRVPFGRPRCETADAWVLATTGAPLGPEPSRRLTPELVAGADLVLTADQGHRGAVIALRPRDRSRVFTLREAAALATALPGAGRGHAPTPATMRAVVDDLDGLRGSDGMPRGTALDVPDAHDGLVPHDDVFAALDRSVRAVATALAGGAVG